jgi:predicted transcriptional regulator
MWQKDAQEAQLSPLELEVMRVLWESAELDAKEVRERLLSERDLTDSTVRTLLRRVEAKGFAGHRKEGRRFLYRATQTSDSAATDEVAGIVRRFYEGSVRQLLVGMVGEGMVDAKQLRELSEAIERSERE